MAKDIQIKYINDQQEWEELYPATKTRIISDDSGQSLNTILGQKMAKNESYTSLQIDGLLTNLQDSIDGIETYHLPVSATEPDDSELWFEIL